ncbi:MAG: M42 family metallopeptidase [Candidatus Firestonebacteria bacterium]
MNKESLKLLKELTEASGVSGYETEVKELLKEQLKGFAKTEYDRLGSVIFRKEGSSETPKVMIPGHMDEVGFMVKYITPDGFIKFLPLGGLYDGVLLSQRVTVKSSKGDVTGVIGCMPPHIMSAEELKKMVGIKDMFIDVGASSKNEVEEEFGINPGDPIIPVSKFEVLRNGKAILAKALDNRAGCALFVDTLKALKKVKHPNTVYGVGTVQEEVGLRGAKTSANVVNPDVCLVAEIGIAADVPGVSEENAIGKLGKGPYIKILDAGMIPNLKLRDLAIATAKKQKIPFQFATLSRGRTDGGMIHFHADGVPSLVIGIPTRYVHSHVSVMHTEDYDNALKLMVELVKVLDKKTVAALI